MRTLFAVWVAASLTAAALAAQPDVGRPMVRERKTGVMGTELVIKAIGPDGAALDAAIEAAIAELRRVEDLMTDWRPSPLMILNDSAGQGPVAVPRELAAIVQRALGVGKLTGGAFDVTFAGVGKLWDFKRDPPRVPDAESIREALQKVDYRRVAADASHVDLPAGMRIGLGGIAKGYGVDRAMRVLMKRGVEHAVVNAGGDMKVLGKNFGEPWEIAIVHPRERGRAMAALKLSNTCVVTSGDYERFFEKDGRRYHHILDPRTGYPADGCISATVVAPNAEFGDALATAMCVLGVEKGLEIIEELPRVEAILVAMDGTVHPSTGLRAAVKAR